MVIDADKIAQRLQRLMNSLNMTQKELAAQLGITQPAISKYLQGRIPPAEVLLRVAQLSQVNIEWILTGSAFTQHGHVAEQMSAYRPASAISEKLERLPAHIRADFEALLNSLVKYF